MQRSGGGRLRGRSAEALVGALWGLIVQNEFEGLAFQVCNSAFEVSNMHLNIACDEMCAPDVVALRVATALFAADLLLEIVKGHLLDGLSRHGQGNGQRTGTDIDAYKNGLKFRQRGLLCRPSPRLAGRRGTVEISTEGPPVMRGL